MGADQDLVDVVVKNCEKKFESILVESKVVGIEQTSGGFAVKIEHAGSDAHR